MEVPEAELMVGYLIKRVQHGLRRRGDGDLHSLGLSVAQYSVLRALDDHPDASAADLARLCFVTRQSLQDVLSGLRSRELVADAGTVRGRSKALRLTAPGRRVLRAANTVMQGVEAELTQGLSEDTRKSLVHLLIRCAENVEG